MLPAGMKLYSALTSFQKQELNLIIPQAPCNGMTARDGLMPNDFDHMINSLQIQCKDELLSHSWLELYATKILDSGYQWTDPSDVVKEQYQLSGRFLWQTEKFMARSCEGSCLCG